MARLATGFRARCARAKGEAALSATSSKAAVVDEQRPSFDRMFAWWQALHVWASLRFDDHLGLMLADIKLVHSSLRAVLTRTKTSGFDKSVEALPIFIAKEAF